MKKIFIIFILFSLLYSFYFSCSSFTFDGANKVRGMNFDYTNNPELKFQFLINMPKDIFLLSFETNWGYAWTMGINDSGIFIPFQLVDSNEFVSDEKGSVFMHNIFMETLSYADNIGFVNEYIGNRRVFSPRGAYTHMMISDLSGNAAIIEAGEYQNEITEKNEEFMLMTNFAVYKFREKNYDEVYGMGATRYINMHDTLIKSGEEISFEEAWEILKSASNSFTDCSTIFFPEEHEIYFCLDCDYDRIWKVSIENRSIETYSGFSEYKNMIINDDGILKSELKMWK